MDNKYNVREKKELRVFTALFLVFAHIMRQTFVCFFLANQFD